MVEINLSKIKGNARADFAILVTKTPPKADGRVSLRIRLDGSVWVVDRKIKVAIALAMRHCVEICNFAIQGARQSVCKKTMKQATAVSIP